MESGKKSISIMSVIVIVFLLAILVSNAVTGYLVFTKWFSSARESLDSFIEITNREITQEINAKLGMLEQINDSYYKLFVTGLLDLADEQQRDKFFVGVLGSQVESIYSFSFGTPNGEYYGARRNESGIIEIMRNNAATGGHSWYYSLAEDLTADELVVEAGAFDPRTRDWYQAALAEDGPSFSPIYKHFIMPDLTISHGRPVYSEAGQFLGVLSNHMLLGDLDAFLTKTIQPYSGYAVIIEKGTNKLIANSLGNPNFAVSDDGVWERNHLSQVDNADLVASFVSAESESEPSFLFKGEKQNLYIKIKEMQKPGLDWLLISAIPEEYLITPVVWSIRSAMVLLVVLVLLAFVVFVLIIKKLFAPLNDLLAATTDFIQGDLTRRIKVVRNDEIGRVSKSFNEASERLQFLVNHLETTVRVRTEELVHLSYHDQLTGLCNRRCFHENMVKMDNATTLPLSVIFADINGLKLTNDIFGHDAGDELIKKTAKILRKSCGEKDLIARIGGDEFVILLPNTDREKAQSILEAIRAASVDAGVRAVRCNVSLGLATRMNLTRSLEQLVSDAEVEMYKDKSDKSKAVNEGVIRTIIETLHAKHPQEKEHSKNVSQISIAIGQALGLGGAEIRKLERAGYLHNIGKIVFADSLFTPDPKTKEELAQIRRHVVVGQRLLNFSDHTLGLADHIYSHHENWDGSGYPRGLQGEEIPLFARIVAVAGVYDRILTDDHFPPEQRQKKALEFVKLNSGKLFDPRVVEAFLEVMENRDSQKEASSD